MLCNKYKLLKRIYYIKVIFYKVFLIQFDGYAKVNSFCTINVKQHRQLAVMHNCQ